VPTEPSDDTRDIDAVWRISLINVADMARRYEAMSRAPLLSGQARSPKEAEDLKAKAAWMLQVLQARAALEAGETQARTNRRLVRVTWFLVGVTAVLAVSAMSHSSSDPTSSSSCPAHERPRH
jgi:hypothetical protein